MRFFFNPLSLCEKWLQSMKHSDGLHTLLLFQYSQVSHVPSSAEEQDK